MIDRAVSGARSRISRGMDEGLLTDQRALLMKSSFPCPSSLLGRTRSLPSRLTFAFFGVFGVLGFFDARGFVRGRGRLRLGRVLSFSLRTS